MRGWRGCSRGLPSACLEGTLRKWPLAALEACWCHPLHSHSERIFPLFFSPPPFFSPFTSFCKWQGCPTWLLIPTLVAVGTAAHLPATPPRPPHAGHSPSPTVPPLPTACDWQNGESFLSAKEITDGEIILTKTRFKKTRQAEHCLGD